MVLEEYKTKRNFKTTKEPPPSNETKTMKNDDANIFVIQKHNARRLHFDFRIEYNGVLKSWAIPKGLSDDSSDKRLAVMTEDHPMEYAKFQGNIPKGEYGAGTVEIWDRGKYVNITVKNGTLQPLDAAIEKGHFIIFLKGTKHEGTYAFTKTEEKNWIVVKKKEQRIEPSEIPVSGRIVRITNGHKELDTGIRKYELVDYYSRVAHFMLPHVKDRLISMFRFPGGVNGKKFFQKNAPDYFPDWMPTKCEKDKGGQTCYTTISDEAGIVYLGNQVVEPHIMVTRIKSKPDKIIFDLDPSTENIAELKRAAVMLRDFLESIGLIPYVMTSGGRGYHIASPIKPELDNDEVRDFALKIANALAHDNKSLTTELMKDKRQGRIFIDVNRNSRHQTSIAPYAARARPKLPIACPFQWDELPNIEPASFTIRNYPKEDAWADFFDNAVSLKIIIQKLKNEAKGNSGIKDK